MPTENVVELEEVIGEPCEDVKNVDICVPTSSMWMVVGAAGLGTFIATVIVDGVPKLVRWTKKTLDNVAIAINERKTRKQDNEDSEDATK